MSSCIHVHILLHGTVGKLHVFAVVKIKIVFSSKGAHIIIMQSCIYAITGTFIHSCK